MTKQNGQITRPTIVMTKSIATMKPIYNIDVRRAFTRSWVKEKGFDYSKEVEVEDIKRWSTMRSDEKGLLSLAYYSWIINAAIKRRKEIRGPAPDDRGWKEEDRFLAFLWCFARCGKLFTVAI
ncbi:hypothetical protein H2248_012625 [Termitomyces sp. 'cryptogamus']|nr:hypothetical protein H2248_012625 [Termitomyces sp. 'cryptogamus']